MTNEQVAKGFNEVYNRFWKRYKDLTPDAYSEEWNRMWDHMTELQKKYPFLENTLRMMMIELDDRKVEKTP